MPVDDFACHYGDQQRRRPDPVGGAKKSSTATSGNGQAKGDRHG
jgi:hypothetical protein